VPADVHGRSILPLLRGEDVGWRKATFHEYYTSKVFSQIPTWRAVRTEEWKYIHYPEHPEWDELYALPSDPNEVTNRVKDITAAPALKELKAELARLVEELGGNP
jgi:N-acetylglucosamine-6-sulfatase